MKNQTFITLFISQVSLACVIGPKQLEVSENHGFRVLIRDSILCEDCKELQIVAPNEFKDMPYYSGAYSILEDGNLISKTAQVNKLDNELPEFIAAIRSDKYEFEVTFSYGNSRCTSYEFKYKSDPEGS
ncbi:MAG: hypothetical protein COB09_12685 [Thalassobium sp.]|nr:MAG: hypothetical protein COB09_12685 [Thalassobium sp.]